MRGLATRYRETLVDRATRTATRMFSKHDTQSDDIKSVESRIPRGTRGGIRRSTVGFASPMFSASFELGSAASSKMAPVLIPRNLGPRWHRERGKNHARVNQSPVVCILRSCGKGRDNVVVDRALFLAKKKRERERDEGKRTSQWQQNLSKFLPANEALSMRMISARENGTRHHETRGLSLPSLSPHLSHHLLYETRTKHDDGNDAWRRYWLRPKHPSYLNRSTCNARCGRCNGSRARDCPTMPISRRTRISKAREQLLGKAI